MIEDSSDQENVDQFPNVPLEDSLNETAVSINIQNQEPDFLQQSQAEKAISQFYHQKLFQKPLFRFDNLEEYKDIFQHGIIGVFDPVPSTYFLPVTILLPFEKYDMRKLRQKIIQKYQAQNIDINIGLNQARKQLSFKIHTKQQLRYYEIRSLSIKQTYHISPQILDEDILINKLYEFYQVFYQKLYFCEVGSLILFWAYRKQFLHRDWLNQSTIKLLIISMYLGLGYGVQNIVRTYKKTEQAKYQLNALKMSKVNRKGQCTIDKQIKQYYNYSIQQKRGFYFVSQKKYQKILSIHPILYPLKRPGEMHYSKANSHYYQNCEQIIMKMKCRGEKVSIMKLLYKVFKMMNGIWNKNQKVVIDLTKKQVIYYINNDKFSLDVIHPVSLKVISKSLNQKDSISSRIKNQLNHTMNKIKNNCNAIDFLKIAFSR